MIGFLARNSFLVFVVVAAFAADQITKYIVIQNVAFRTSWPASGFFRITHVGNTGSAFGLVGDQNTALVVASFIGIAILVYFYRAHPNSGRLVRLSLGLMLAGALGNLTDRLLNGHVTDFIDIGPWWIFNLADASIVTGITVLAATVLLAPTPGAAAADGEAPPDDEAAEELGVIPVAAESQATQEPVDDDGSSS